MFQKARLKLTINYILIISLIASVISGAFYYRANTIFNNEYKRIETRVEKQRQLLPPNFQPPRFQITPIEIADAKKSLAIQLLKINAMVIALTAISSYILAGQTLDPIQEVMNKQQRFIADASHELKTPLTSLITSIEVSLMDKKLKSSMKKLLQDNLEDIKSLHKLTESLLTLSRIKDNGLNHAVISIKDILTKSIIDVKPIASKKRIKLKLSNISRIIKVRGEERYLVELFNNLLENAIKYSKNGKQVVVKSEVSPSSVSVSIIDNGIGIDKKHIPHIFDRFFRVDESHSRARETGFGLGLSLAKQIAETHKGSLTVKSELGKGSTFTVTLPRA